MTNIFYKSVPSKLLKPVGVRTKVYSKQRITGVVGIVRDYYGKRSDWYNLCQEVKKRDGFKCVFCKKPESIKEGVFHHVHHIRRLADGGTTTKSNLVLTCESCHSKRPGHSHLINRTTS